MIKEYFDKERNEVVRKIKEMPHDMAFVLVADSHLDDYEEDTIKNIQAVND